MLVSLGASFDPSVVERIKRAVWVVKLHLFTVSDASDVTLHQGSERRSTWNIFEHFDIPGNDGSAEFGTWELKHIGHASKMP